MNNLIFAMLILSADSSAQTDRAPVEADQVFQTDFGAEVDVNRDGWPDGWTRRRGKGYPTYLPVDIVDDDSPTKSENRCLRIKLDGGAAQLFTPPMAVTPQFSYQLRSKIRTRGLKHDEVSLLITFYDGEDKLLEQFESDRLRVAREWTAVNIGPISPASDRVRTAVISLHVRPTDRADMVGEIWCDDLWLGRLPKMSLENLREHGLYKDPASVRVTCRISGFKNARPQMTFTLFDIHGKALVASQQELKAEADTSRLRQGRNGSTTSIHTGFAGSLTWKPPVTDAGFYTVRVATPGHSGFMIQDEVHFVVVPPLTRGKSGEFGWAFPNGERPLSIRALPSLLGESGIHWVKFPVWFSAQESKRAEELAWFAERISSYDMQMVGVLDQPPREVCEYFGAKETIPIATVFTDKAVWHPALDPVMTRLSLKVRWWQLGHDQDLSFASFPDLAGKLKEIRHELTSFGQQVNVGVPWRAIEEHPLNGATPWAFLSMNEELPFTDVELQSYVDARETTTTKQWLMLKPLPKHDYDLETRARDLVMRMLSAKVARAKGIFIPEPFDARHGLMNPDGSPGELYLPWRTTASLIGGGEHLGSIRLPNGSTNHVFTHENQAVMVAWNDTATTESMYVGDDVQQFDIWGHASQPRSAEDGAAGHTFDIGPMPTFITGVHPAIAKWRMQFQFETGRLASVFGREQIVTYQFSNTFPHAVGGRVRMCPPSDWKCDGVDRQFKIGAGETRKDAFRVLLGADSPTGTQPVRIEFDLTADRNFNFSHFETLQVGLGDVLVELETRLDDQGNLLVEQQLINNSDTHVSFKCFLSAPGHRRERQQVFNLGRGRTTNVFVFPNGKELLGQTLRFRAEEIGGIRLINDQIVAHD